LCDESTSFISVQRDQISSLASAKWTDFSARRIIGPLGRLNSGQLPPTLGVAQGLVKGKAFGLTKSCSWPKNWMRLCIYFVLSVILFSMPHCFLYGEDGEKTITATNATTGQPIPKELEGVGITQNLDAQIPLDLEFLDSTGKPVTLGQLINGKLPTIITMNYSDCPMLCSLQLNGLIDAIKSMTWQLGRDYQIITVSIDPLESPERAQLTKQKYLEAYGRMGSANGWLFLTSRKAEQIKKLADCIGFGYKYLPEKKQYIHPALLTICTPEGRVSKYFSGIKYNPRDLRLALFEAGEGKVGSAVDQVLMYCFHYDPESGTYSWAAMRFMRIGGVLTLIFLGAMLAIFWMRERRKSKNIEMATN
jgi:protein SCO1